MNRIHTKRSQIFAEIYAAFPDSLGMTLHDAGSACEIRNDQYTIYLAFERYEDRLAVQEIAKSPRRPESRAMAAWILFHVLGVNPGGPGIRPYFEFGQALVKCCRLLMQEGRDVESEYFSLENRIIDGSMEVHRLPDDHPIQKRFQDADLQWLADIEALDP